MDLAPFADRDKNMAPYWHHASGTKVADSAGRVYKGRLHKQLPNTAAVGGLVPPTDFKSDVSGYAG